MARDTREIKLDEHSVERFWRAVWAKGDDECWPFGKMCNRAGYGSFSLRDAKTGDWRMFLAPRVAYTAAYGPIPEGLVVRHACDNPVCCNPLHLQAGTVAENMQDMKSRKRRTYPSGEDHAASRITAQDALDIRAARRAGVPRKVLADRYGLTKGGIRHVACGNSWKHVPGAIQKGEIPSGRE